MLSDKFCCYRSLWDELQGETNFPTSKCMENYVYFLLHDAISEYFFAAHPLISLEQIIWLLIFEVFYTPQGVVINCVFFFKLSFYIAKR